VLVGVLVGELVGVLVGVFVGVFVAGTGVLVGVFVGVSVGGIGVFVGVLVGVSVPTTCINTAPWPAPPCPGAMTAARLMEAAETERDVRVNPTAESVANNDVRTGKVKARSVKTTAAGRNTSFAGLPTAPPWFDLFVAGTT